MAEIKMSATILLPGASMCNPSECFVEKDGKKIRKNEMFDSFTLKLDDGRKKESITVHTRKCAPAKQVIYITDEAYNAWTAKEKPSEYRESTPWLKLTIKQRIAWHLEQIAKDRGGKLEDFDYID